MKITFDETVKNRLAELTKSQAADFVLDFDHTLSRQNWGSDCCGVTRYRIVAVDKGQVPSIFDGIIPSNMGDIYVQNWGRMYLDEAMSIRQNGVFTEFNGAGGQIAPNMEITDFRGEKLLTTREQVSAK